MKINNFIITVGALALLVGCDNGGGMKVKDWQDYQSQIDNRQKQALADLKAGKAVGPGVEVTKIAVPKDERVLFCGEAAMPGARWKYVVTSPVGRDDVFVYRYETGEFKIVTIGRVE